MSKTLRVLQISRITGLEECLRALPMPEVVCFNVASDIHDTTKLCEEVATANVIVGG